MLFQNSKYMIYRVTSPVTLDAISAALGSPLLEAARMPGKAYSVYRAWTTTGQCYEMLKAGPQAMQPVRRSQFDRTVTPS